MGLGTMSCAFKDSKKFSSASNFKIGIVMQRLVRCKRRQAQIPTIPRIILMRTWNRKSSLWNPVHLMHLIQMREAHEMKRGRWCLSRHLMVFLRYFFL